MIFSDLNFRPIQRLFASLVLALFAGTAFAVDGQDLQRSEAHSRLVVNGSAVNVSDIDEITKGWCMKYQTITSSDVLFLGKEIDASPYRLEEVLSRPVCHPRMIGGHNKITMLQFTVEDSYSRLGHMEKMYKYTMKKHKNEQIWLNAINATNTDGMTMLDYIHFRLGNGNYTSDQGRAQMGKVRQFVCEHGGVYKKYPQRSCSDPSF